MDNLVVYRQPGYGLFFKNLGIKSIKPGRRLKSRADVVFNYGVPDDFPYPHKFIINRPSIFISKPSFRKIMERNEVRIPKTFYTSDEAREFLTRNRTTLVGRRRNHTKGSHFHIVNTQEDLARSVRDGCEYWSMLLPKDREYRAFILFGRVFNVARKIPRPGHEGAANWNRENAAFENVRWDNWPINGLNWAIKAFYSINYLGFAAIDFILSDHRFYILEQNCSPGIESDYRLKCLKDALEYDYNFIMSNNALPNRALVTAQTYRDLVHPGVLK